MTAHSFPNARNDSECWVICRLWQHNIDNYGILGSWFAVFRKWKFLPTWWMRVSGSQRVSEGPRVVRTVCTDFQRKISISVINIDARLHTKGLPLVSDIIFEMILHLPGGSLDFNTGTTPCLLPPHPPPCAYPLLTYWEPSRQPHHSETATPTPSQALGYNTFGAGGFFGDSEKAPGQWIQCWSWLSLKVSIFWGKRLQRRYLVRWKLKSWRT